METQMLDLSQVKDRQQQMWSSADYASVGNRILVVSELLCDAVDLQGGEDVLDVACGSGNAALAAARRFGRVTGVDFAPALLERARQRAGAEGLEVDFKEGDAEELPFDDNSFDVVLSACGAMFAPDQERTAEELLRVTRPGGRIGMVNWTPQSWVAELSQTIARHVPPPPGLPSPVGWGDRPRLQELLGHGADIDATDRTFAFRFPSVAHHVDFLTTSYPPVRAAMLTLEDDGRAALEADLASLAARRSVGPGDHLVLPMDYLEVVATTRRATGRSHRSADPERSAR